MADIVNSLFGLSPQEMRAEKLAANRERSLGLAALAPEGYGAIVAGAGDIGFALGEGLGSLFGMEDPALTKAKNIENVLGMVQNELGPDGISDPTKLYPLLSQKLNEAGLSREATKVSLMGTDEIAKYRKNEAEINKLKASQASSKRTNLSLAKQDLKDAQEKLSLDPENPMLQADVNDYQAAVDKLTSNILSTDQQLSEANRIYTDPNSHPSDRMRALDMINTITSTKKLGGEGMYWDIEQQAYRAIPGGKSWKTSVDTFNKKASGKAAKAARLDLINQSIDTAMGLISPKSTGIVGKTASKLPNTDAYRLQKAIDPIISKIGFDALQDMRDQSKTGGALGQVAVRELEMLQASILSLDIGLDEETLKINLEAVRDQYESALREYNLYMDKMNLWIKAGGDPGNPPQTDEEFEEFIAKSGINSSAAESSEQAFTWEYNEDRTKRRKVYNK